MYKRSRNKKIKQLSLLWMDTFHKADNKKTTTQTLYWKKKMRT
ncbi:MAG: hypothetical protein ACPGO5_03840 [Patescibacteria group bacterium]